MHAGEGIFVSNRAFLCRTGLFCVEPCNLLSNRAFLCRMSVIIWHQTIACFNVDSSSHSGCWIQFTLALSSFVFHDLVTHLLISLWLKKCYAMFYIIKFTQHTFFKCSRIWIPEKTYVSLSSLRLEKCCQVVGFNPLFIFSAALAFLSKGRKSGRRSTTASNLQWWVFLSVVSLYIFFHNTTHSEFSCNKLGSTMRKLGNAIFRIPNRICLSFALLSSVVFVSLYYQF